MKTKKIIVLGIIACGIAMWTFGCGSSDQQGETSAALSKAEFLKEGDRICKERLEEKDKVVKAALEESFKTEGNNPSDQKLEEVGEEILAPFQKLATEFNELSPPANGEAAAEDISAKLQAALKKAEADPAKLSQIDPFEGAAQAAREYGFTACNL